MAFPYSLLATHAWPDAMLTSFCRRHVDDAHGPAAARDDTEVQLAAITESFGAGRSRNREMAARDFPVRSFMIATIVSAWQ
jgi:hypothetical protein